MMRIRPSLRRLGLSSLGGALLLACAGAVPSLALMPPYVYETARAEAQSVIVIAVEDVQLTRREFGNCTVVGSVQTVERGTAFSVGQKVELSVPCQRENASPPLGGTIYQSMDALKKAKFGRAYLDADGKVALSQYYPLTSLTEGPPRTQ